MRWCNGRPLLGNEKQADAKSFITCIHVKHYRKFKDLIHPIITTNIDYYKRRNYYLFSTYHGCGLRNRSGIKKRVDYKRGYQCVLPSSYPYWRRTKEKYTQTKIHNTRYQTHYNIRALAMVKGHYYYNQKFKEYKHNWWHKRIGF